LTVTLAHLPNTLCSVWADGQPIGSGTTDGSGVLTMPDGSLHSNIVAGLGGVVISSAAPDASALLTDTLDPILVDP